MNGHRNAPLGVTYLHRGLLIRLIWYHGYSRHVQQHLHKIKQFIFQFKRRPFVLKHPQFEFLLIKSNNLPIRYTLSQFPESSPQLRFIIYGILLLLVVRKGEFVVSLGDHHRVAWVVVVVPLLTEIIIPINHELIGIETILIWPFACLALCLVCSLFQMPRRGQSAALLLSIHF